MTLSILYPNEKCDSEYLAIFFLHRCALEKDSSGKVVTNRWGDCSTYNRICPIENNNNNNNNNYGDCYTTGGPDRNKQCIFPFIHGGVKYHDCTRESETILVDN